MDNHRLETLERKVANLQWYIDKMSAGLSEVQDELRRLRLEPFINQSRKDINMLSKLVLELQEKQKAQAVEPEPCTVCQSNQCPGSPRFKGVCKLLSR